MARKDEILKAFLGHDLLAAEYKIPDHGIPSTVRDALHSNYPIIQAIALIVDGLEGKPPMTDNELRSMIPKFLNEAI